MPLAFDLRGERRYVDAVAAARVEAAESTRVAAQAAVQAAVQEEAAYVEVRVSLRYNSRAAGIQLRANNCNMSMTMSMFMSM